MEENHQKEEKKKSIIWPLFGVLQLCNYFSSVDTFFLLLLLFLASSFVYTLLHLFFRPWRRGGFYVKCEQEPTGSGYNTLQSNNSFSFSSICYYLFILFELYTRRVLACYHFLFFFWFVSPEFLICLSSYACLYVCTCTVYSLQYIRPKMALFAYRFVRCQACWVAHDGDSNGNEILKYVTNARGRMYGRK